MNENTPLHLRRMTVAEYLAFEEQSDLKHEYVNGHIYPLHGYEVPPGTTERHNVIVGNLFGTLWQASRSSGCRVLFSDMKLQVGDDDTYSADVMVVCDPADRDPYLKTRPLIIAEVMSLATLRRDRAEKLRAYLEIPSLRYCIMVHENDPLIEWHWRDEHGVWRADVVEGERSLAIPELGVELTLTQIYSGVEVG